MVRIDSLDPTTIPWLPAPISRSAAYRAAAAGQGKPQLLTYKIASHRYTTPADLRQYFSELTIGKSGRSPTPAARQRSIARAQTILEVAGIQ